MSPAPPLAAGQAHDYTWHVALAICYNPLMIDTMCGLMDLRVIALEVPGGPPYLTGKACEACHREPAR